MENASPEAIINALEKARCEISEPKEIFTPELLFEYHLIGHSNSAVLREKLGAELGLGYSNGKQLLSKLNRYNITMKEFQKAFENINK